MKELELHKVNWNPSPPEISTLGNRLQTKILAGIYISNFLLFYICTLWTIRLFQPLKVFSE